MKKITCFLTMIFLTGCFKNFEQAEQKTVNRIDAGFANVYLLRGLGGNILVDTGSPGSETFIVKQLKKIGISPENISLIVLTHGHSDHAGGAKYFKKNYHIPVMVGSGDETMLKTGKNGELLPTDWRGSLLKPFLEQEYKPFRPDIIVENEYNLEKFGIKGRVIHVGGHTPGSLVLILNNGEALVGDLIRGGLFNNAEPQLHFFHENKTKVKPIIDSLLQKQVKVFYTGHFGPLSPEKLKHYNEQE